MAEKRTRSWERRQRVVTGMFMAAFGAALVILLFFACQSAHAFGLNTLLDFLDSVKSLALSVKDKFDTIVNFIKDPASLVDVLFDGIDNALSGVLNNSVMIDVLDELFSDSSRYLKSVENYGTGLYTGIRAISMGIALTGCLMAAIDEASVTLGRPETWLRHLWEFGVLSVIIDHCADLQKGFSKIGLHIVHISRNYADKRSDYKVSVLESFKEAAGIGAGSAMKALILGILGLIAIFLLSMTVLQIIKIRLYIICIGILFELAARSLFLPLGISWFGLDGARGRSMHYIKAYIGVWMRIGICYIAAFLLSVFASFVSDVTSGVNLLVLIAIWYTMPALAQTSGNIVGNILD